MKMSRIWIVISVLVLAALACQIPGTAPVVPDAPNLPPPTPVTLNQPAPVAVDTAGRQEALVSLYEQVMPGIVSLQVVGNGGGSLGSGFVYDDQGHILTNYHVVEGATQVEVDFTSGYKIYGTVVGTDLDSDLAVVKVNAPASELHPVPLGDSNSLKVGQTVIAIGNPFGLSGSMTTGVISALGRTLDSQNDAPGGGFFTAGDIIQTDAAINPGNSGGPLLNLQGEVVGVNAQIETGGTSNSNLGIGFAIPVNIVKLVVPDLIAKGSHDWAWMGVRGGSLFPALVDAMDLPFNKGAYISEVPADGPAENAGLRGANDTRVVDGRQLEVGGDVIVAINGEAVNSFDDLLIYITLNTQPGDEITVTVYRDGEYRDITVELEQRPDQVGLQTSAS